MSPRARRGFFFQKTGTCPAARYSSGKSIFQRVCVDRDLHHGGNWFKTRQSNRQVTFSVYAKPCVFATTSRNPSNESMSGLGFQNAFKQWCMQQFVLQALIVSCCETQTLRCALFFRQKNATKFQCCNIHTHYSLLFYQVIISSRKLY